MVYYNPLDKFYKSQLGAVCAHEDVTFRVKGNFGSVVFVCKNDGEEKYRRVTMEKRGDYFEAHLSFDTGLYFYYFDVDESFLGLGDNYLADFIPESYFQLTVYDKEYIVPNWIYGGVIYQIFPDRFYRAEQVKKVEQNKLLHLNWYDTPKYLPNKFGKVENNDFFGGDLKGIAQKLPYLKDLGVTVIYLNPIFKAYSNHRYDTGDYMQIDPLLGDENDLINLINSADSLGIKIVLDGVFNHTGDDSLYFNKYGSYDSLGAYQSKDSPYYSWFNFTNFPNGYESWWGISTLPQVNESDEGYIDFITCKNGVIDHYTKLGIGGWRLDVVDELPKEFVQKIRSAVKSVNKEATIIGEVWEDASNKIAYGVRREYFQGKELDSVMNYPLKNAIINFIRNKDSIGLSNVIKTQIDHYPTKVLHNLMNILSTHDTLRLMTALCGRDMTGKTKAEMDFVKIEGDDYSKAVKCVKLASLLQFTLCGVPSVYYGDEIGMQGYIDPLNRKCFNWDKQDEQLKEWYKFLGKLRNDYDAFSDGEFNEEFVGEGVYAFKRVGKKSQLFIIVNASDLDYKLSFDGCLFDLVANKEQKSGMSIKSLSCAILIKK